MEIITGSICLSRIPKELIKKVMCKDGVERMFLNIAIIEKKEKGQFGDTHFITCAPRKEEQKEGVNYIIGDMKLYVPAPTVSAQEIDDAPSIDPNDDLPF